MHACYRRIFLILFALVLFSSCVPKERIVYMNDIEAKGSYEKEKRYEPTIRPDDLLFITVASENPELVLQFNNAISSSTTTQDKSLLGYLVDNDGFIDFPSLGKVKLGGLTKADANAVMKQKLGDFVTNPTVNIRILNFKVSVLGEVTRPGPVTLLGERVSLPDALSAAGDLTIFGKRNNILLIRDEDGKKTYARLDLTKSDFIDSPYYYLKQNDVVYVEPNQVKINQSALGNLTTFIAIGTFAVTLALFISSL